MRRITLAASLGLALVVATISIPIAQANDKAPTPAASESAKPAARAAAIADRAAASGFDNLAKGPEETLRRQSVVPGGRPGRTLYNVVYQRTYDGLPVVGADAIVITDANGTILQTVGDGPMTALPTTTPAISAGRATTIAKTRVGTVETASKPRLIAFAQGKKSTLAWETTVRGTTRDLPSVLQVFVDAGSGKVVDTWENVRMGTGSGFYNGQVSITTSGSGTSFSMTDNSRPGLRCGGQNGAAFTGTDDAWGNGSGTNLETGCVDALYAAQKEWDMLAGWMNYNGFNGNGGAFPARVGLNDVNAFWNGSYTNFGHSQDNQRQATPIDVVTHEYGHAIFQFAGTDGAGSGAERGGMNEANGDIFGAISEAYANNPNDPPDFYVGEEVNLVGDGPIRDMYNPASLGDPSCYPQLTSGTEVHAGAGPLNHWFTLLARGSGGSPNVPVCAGGAVTGIGIQKAGQIYMAALQTKNPSTWSHVNARAATLNAAKNLFPGSCAEWTAVRNAWNAIQVPAGSNETCTPATGNDWSMSLNPASRQVNPGSSTTSAISTSTIVGTPQSITFSATGLPSGATASFSPATLTSGASSTLTVTTSSSTPVGIYQVAINGNGTEDDHSATFQLTVGNPSTCSALPETHTGTFTATNQNQYWPGTTGWAANAGTFNGCLDGPNGVDFDLYLQRLNTSGTWSTVAQGITSAPDESVSFNGTAGTYRWRVHAFSGTGSYTMGMNRP
ncbi:M4 family metallopeptidase [Flindersiella endophytica]